MVNVRIWTMFGVCQSLITRWNFSLCLEESLQMRLNLGSRSPLRISLTWCLSENLIGEGIGDVMADEKGHNDTVGCFIVECTCKHNRTLWLNASMAAYFLNDILNRIWLKYVPGFFFFLPKWLVKFLKSMQSLVMSAFGIQGQFIFWLHNLW